LVLASSGKIHKYSFCSTFYLIPIRIKKCVHEARFGQQGTLTRQWALKETRPAAWQQTQYEYLYVFGAACSQTGQTVGLLASYLNTDTVNAFFRQFEAQFLRRWYYGLLSLVRPIKHH